MAGRGPKADLHRPTTDKPDDDPRPLLRRAEAVMPSQPRTPPLLGSRLLAALSLGPATFEIDGGDPVERTGWSVIIAGQGEEVTDPAEIERLEAFELEPWAPGLKTHWVRIRATSISGRRIVRVSDAMLG